MRHPWQHLGGTVTFPDCGTVFPWASLPGGFEGVGPFPSLVLPSIRLGLRGFGIAGPLVGGALLPSLADPAKIRVSTYCEIALAYGINRASEGKTPERNK